MKVQIDDTLTLRQLKVSEYQTMFDLVDKNREQLRRWLPWVDYVTEAENYKSTIQAWIDSNDASQSMTLGVYLNDQLVGMCGFNTIDLLNRRGAIGYWLAEEYNGQGIMTRAVRGLVDYAFKKLELHRVEISAGVENHQSRKIAERLGFEEEARLKEYEFLYDHYHDLVQYRMMSRDWLTKN